MENFKFICFACENFDNPVKMKKSQRLVRKRCDDHFDGKACLGGSFFSAGQLRNIN